MTAEIVIRPARDEDGDGWSRLIARSWADYPGVFYDRHGELQELDAIASHYEEKGGLAWTAVNGEKVVGSIAIAPAGEVGDAWEITKMYVDPAIRRAGLATLLLEAAETFAVERDAARMVLWTDTRFEGAHRFYERRGYIHDGRTRALYDLSDSVEYFYSRRLSD